MHMLSSITEAFHVKYFTRVLTSCSAVCDEKEVFQSSLLLLSTAEVRQKHVFSSNLMTSCGVLRLQYFCNVKFINIEGFKLKLEFSSATAKCANYYLDMDHLFLCLLTYQFFFLLQMEHAH